MSSIDYIKNVSTYAILTADGTWTLPGGFPQDATEIIIRQITYAAAVAVSDICLISCNLSGSQIIGSAVSSTNFTSCPQTTITLRSPLPNQLTFQLMHPSQPLVALSPIRDPTGDMISITMDFVKRRH